MAGNGVLEGFVDYYGPERIRGWAWDGRRPDQPVEVEAWIGDRCVGGARADQPRADLVVPGARSGCQGFEIVPPALLAAGELDRLEVRIKGTGVRLVFSRRRQVLAGVVPSDPFDRLALPRAESPFLEEIIARDKIAAPEAQILREFSARGLLKFRIEDPDFDRLATHVLQRMSAQAERRVQDAWQQDEAVRRLACLPEVLGRLELLYGRGPVPMQTLNFLYGSEQSTHADTVHFNSLPPRFMCGVWIALEPVTDRNGPLHYYPGSHRLPVIGLDELGLVADPLAWSENYEAHQEVLRALVRTHGLRKEILHADRGEAIIWAANLYHGGEPIADAGSTRHSQVTHYYFEGCGYYSPMASNVYLGRLCRPDRRDVRTGAPLVPVFGPLRLPMDIPLEAAGAEAMAPPAGAVPAPPRSRARSIVARLRRWISGAGPARPSPG